MSYGVTDKGFVKKGFQTILEEVTAKFQEIFGDDLDLDDATPQKQLIVAYAERISALEDVAELVYNNFNINNSQFSNLDYHVKKIGIVRVQASKSAVTVTISGDDGTTIPVGFTISTSNDIKFQSIESGEISGGTLDLEFESVEVGINQNVANGTLVEIDTPIIGVDSVTNSLSATGGRERETDDQLRARYFDTLSIGGGSTADAIRAGLLSYDDILDVKVIENDTESTVNGIPEK